MRSRLRIWGCVLSALAGLLSAACSDSAGPLYVGEVVFVVGGQQRTSIAAVEGLTGRVLARPHPVPANKVAASLSSDGGTLYLLGADRSGRQLMALDTHTLTFRWLVPLNSPVATHTADGLWIDGTAIASSPDGTRLVVGGAFSVDPAHDPSPANEFVAVLDAQTRDVVGKVGPLQVVEGSGLATVPPCSGAPNGFVVGIGTHVTTSNDPTARSLLFTIDPGVLTILDSAALTTPGVDAPADLLVQIVAAPQGCVVYAQGASGTLYAYDLVARHVIATAAAVLGTIAVAPDGSADYLSDFGDFFDSPGSGLIRVFGPALEPRAPIDLNNQPALGHDTPRTSGLAVSPDGARLYVVTGTSALGPNFGTQPLRVAAISLSTGKMLYTTSLDDSGGASLFVVQ